MILPEPGVCKKARERAKKKYAHPCSRDRGKFQAGRGYKKQAMDERLTEYLKAQKVIRTSVLKNGQKLAQ